MKYFLYYAGFNNDNGQEQIGVAESVDLNDWKYLGNSPIIPLGSQGEYDEKQTSNPCVLKHGNIYKCWYQGKSKTGLISICYAESKNGLEWRVKKDIVFSPLPTKEAEYLFGYHHPHVIFDDNRNIFRMWCVVHKDGMTTIGYCESNDGIKWSAVTNTNLKSPDKNLKYFYPFILLDNGKYKMWITERKSNRRWKIIYAESEDGLNWKINKEKELNPSFPNLFVLFFEGLAKVFKIFVKLPIYGIGSPYVWKTEDKYFLIGHAVGPRGKLYIPLYESKDGLDWKKSKNNIVPDPKTSWNKFFQADPYLYYVEE